VSAGAGHPGVPLLAALATAWIAWGMLHSLLAGAGAKAWVAARWPRLAARERLLYNAVALATLAGPLWLLATASGPALWSMPAGVAVAADLAAIVALAAFAWTLRWYDGRAFLGLRTASGSPGLVVSPLHRWVRHPWYSLSLVLIWTREMDAAWLVSALVLTLYLIVGCRHEESGLLREHGDAYREYASRVPALLPWRGCALDAEAAARLAQPAGRSRA
jgi:protein-S-isoprenylcysteine O-methyltransferase Ste14